MSSMSLLFYTRGGNQNDILFFPPPLNCFSFIINVGVWVSLCVPQLILRVLKLTTIRGE